MLQPSIISTTPLSPNTQATLEKHGLSGSTTKKLPSLISPPKKTKRDIGCITDVCGSDDIDEIEIISLLEEQLPRYKLRADSITKFGGYKNNDWCLEYPAFPIPEGGLKITRELAQETLNYFLLSGDRVSQMTRTYDDPEAIARLLEEKEKDLELTVQIGKELLAQNGQLESRINDLESELRKAVEDTNQLRHDLEKKNELLGVLTSDLDDRSESGTPLETKSINFEILQRKVSTLETENKKLRTEVEQIADKTTEVEEQERKLMEDIAFQLSSANNESHAISLELERYKEENRFQQEQITDLTARLHSTQLRLHQLLTENEETSSLLNITTENQNALARELNDFKTQYNEVLTLLRDAQEQIKKQKRRTLPVARNSVLATSYVGRDSLQSELMEMSLLSENSLDSGIMADVKSSEYRRVFETVKYANQNLPGGDTLSTVSSVMSSSNPRMSSMLSSSSAYQHGDIMSIGDSGTPMEEYPAPLPVGVPGTPGAKDLETALKRLVPAEIAARRAMFSASTLNTYAYDDADGGSVTGTKTPDSVYSHSSGRTGISSMSSGQWKIPEKLKIVKPMEGSQTLFHWQKLATPTLGSLLEEKSGVAVRGTKTLEDLGLQMYTLEDVEEDEELVPQKRFQQSSTIFTYTNSTVLHPDDGTAVTFSLPPSQMTSVLNSAVSSRQPSAPATPRSSLSRRNSCSTFSVHMGLASVLNERGIKAVTPSVLNTPAGPNYTPTVTPCNSPDLSPTREYADQPLLSGLLASGADLLRRKLTGMSAVERPSRIQSRNNLALSRLERKALRSIRILEKVESVGVKKLMAPATTTVSSLALHSTSVYSGHVRRSDSPMTQLTSLQRMGASDDVVIRKETIKAVLSKGLSHDPKLANVAEHDSSEEDDGESNSKQQQQQDNSNNASSSTDVKGPTETSAVIADTCVKRLQRQKSRRNMNATGTRRADLGTVNNSNNSNSNNNRPSEKDLGTESAATRDSSFTQGFVGTLSSLIFGRKGGFT